MEYSLIFNDLYQKDKQDKQDSQNRCVLQKNKKAEAPPFA